MKSRSEQLNCFNGGQGDCGNCKATLYTTDYILYCPVPGKNNSTRLVKLVSGQDYHREDVFSRQPDKAPPFLQQPVYNKPPSRLEVFIRRITKR